MPNIKNGPDIKRFTGYQSVINFLLITEAEPARREGRSYESASGLLAKIKSNQLVIAEGYNQNLSLIENRVQLK